MAKSTRSGFSNIRENPPVAPVEEAVEAPVVAEEEAPVAHGTVETVAAEPEPTPEPKPKRKKKWASSSS